MVSFFQAAVSLRDFDEIVAKLGGHAACLTAIRQLPSVSTSLGGEAEILCAPVTYKLLLPAANSLEVVEATRTPITSPLLSNNVTVNSQLVMESYVIAEEEDSLLDLPLTYFPLSLPEKLQNDADLCRLREEVCLFFLPSLFSGKREPGEARGRVLLEYPFSHWVVELPFVVSINSLSFLLLLRSASLLSFPLFLFLFPFPSFPFSLSLSLSLSRSTQEATMSLQLSCVFL